MIVLLMYLLIPALIQNKESDSNLVLLYPNPCYLDILNYMSLVQTYMPDVFYFVHTFIFFFSWDVCVE